MDDIRGFESHFASARAETIELVVRLLEEVAALDPQFAPECHLACAEFGMSVDVLGYQCLSLAFGIIGNKQFDRIEDSAYARCSFF